MSAARRAPDRLPVARRGFLASGLGIALFSSAVFGLSGSFAKALLNRDGLRGRLLRRGSPAQP